MASSPGGNIKVVVRVRPFNGRELDRKATCVVQMNGAQTILTPPTAIDPRSKTTKAALEGTKTFAFDRSYWSFDPKDPHFAGQDALFADLGRPLLDNAFQGYNNCIFAYGQTGSGKSYSMMGYGKEAGVIPRICRDMFDRIENLQVDDNLSCTVEVSYLEIYNERVRDLLNPSTKGNLRVREHPSTGPYVEDLAKLAVRSFQEIENLMDEGNKARTVAATNMNETSSRSHAVFTLTLTQKRHDVETNMDTEKVAKISLVDLAGSERATSTGATGARLKEGAEINRSLSTLGRVIASLADLSSGKKKNASLVPYRDSVLTWLLKDSLGGNSLTAMIAAISPADINFEETLSTLRYADSAKRIKNHAVVNEDPNARMIRELKEELAQLRAKLNGAGTPGAAQDEYYAPDTPLEQQIVSITQADGTVKKVSKAEIAEQLSQSEKLYKDLNQTWEEKLQKTEEIHREREAALEELGISIETGFVGLSTPRKMPHLVNLSDDPLLAECLVYNLKPGTTTVGNVEAEPSAEIRLNGSKILPDHCTFENVDGMVTVVPKDNAAVMVNGVRIEKPKRLRSGYRVILGDFHIFRFNHPQEARAERAEHGNLLRHSITASQLASQAARPGHDRSWSVISKAESDFEVESPREDAPSPLPRGRDSDWSFARREAATAILGTDQKISNLTDDELDILFDDLQRVRAGRRGRPESRLFDVEDDADSMNSYPVREKYASNATIDNFSIDTALTVPSTPQQNGDTDDRLRTLREEMQSQLDKQKEEYLRKLKVAEKSNLELEDVRAEKARMEEDLRSVKEDMQRQFARQKEEFELQLRSLRNGADSEQTALERTSTHVDIMIKRVLQHWRRQRHVRMAEEIMRNTAVLKEAQVMSQQMGKTVVFQFCVIDVGQTLPSSYDLVLNGVGSEEDECLEASPKPCIAVRVVDFKDNVIHVWSTQKLHQRIRLMRQMLQYMDRPEYLRHFRLDNPFSESCVPRYSRIGDADVPLAAVYESRVQDFTTEVFSPYTFNVIGILRLSLEPSSAEAPLVTVKFNVVMHDLVGFSEREGTDVHAQLYVLGVSEEVGATTTQLIQGFDDGPIRFESVHSMSLPLSSTPESCLRISIFADVTSTHLDRLLSWDDIRDSATRPHQEKARLADSEYHTEERHDIFTRVQIQELSEEGNYRPVAVVQSSLVDQGAFQLHQGLQRRFVVSITHSSRDVMKWENISVLRVGGIRYLDPSGRVADLDTSQPDVLLRLASPPTVKHEPDGTSSVIFTGQWDSSVHGSPLLDRPTAERYRVQVALSWEVTCDKLAEPMVFSLDVLLQVLPRSSFRSVSVFSQLLNPIKTVHSTVGMFAITLRPTSMKSASNLWRMNTRHSYVKGEEELTSWAPRSASLVLDYLSNHRRRRRLAEMETARGILSAQVLAISGKPSADEAQPITPEQEHVLRKVLSLWTIEHDIAKAMLSNENLEAPRNGAAFATDRNGASIPYIVAEVCYIPKNPIVLKSGYLMMPDRTNSRWIRRFAELRRPYLHVYSVPEGDEVNAINLNRSRIDHQPQLAKLLARPNAHVFAVFAPQNTFLLASRSERDKIEWIVTIDQSFSSSGRNTPERDG